MSIYYDYHLGAHLLTESKCSFFVRLLLYPSLLSLLEIQGDAYLLCAQSSDLFSLHSKLISFFFPLRTTTRRLVLQEINSRVANMKLHFVHWGRRKHIGCQFFQATILYALSDSGCCSVLKKCVCEWVILSLQRGSCVCVCVCFSMPVCRNMPWEGSFYDFRTVWFKDEVGLFF